MRRLGTRFAGFLLRLVGLELKSNRIEPPHCCG